MVTQYNIEMYSVQLSAGHLSANIQTDEPDVNLNECVSAAHNELHWMMKQYAEIDGEMVGIEHPEPTFGGR
jgi:hypothetical protein